MTALFIVCHALLPNIVLYQLQLSTVLHKQAAKLLLVKRKHNGWINSTKLQAQQTQRNTLLLACLSLSMLQQPS